VCELGVSSTGEPFDQHMHLTNSVVQQNNPDGVKLEELTLHSDTSLCELWTAEQRAQMKRLVVLSLLSARSALPTSADSGTDELSRYQMLGYDFMVDAASKVWLLEVNNAPGLEMTSMPERRIQVPMLRDLVRLVLDVEQLGTVSALPPLEAYTVSGGFTLLTEELAEEF